MRLASVATRADTASATLVRSRPRREPEALGYPAAGTTHTQLSPVQAVLSARLRHARPVQQAWVALHAVFAPLQLDGAVQTPLVQVSVALQHGTVAEQLCVVCPHTDATAHVPEVAPAGIEQEAPAQQSAFTVQLPPTAMQPVPPPPPPPVPPPLPLQSAHLWSVQVPLQQSVAAAHVPPLSLQALLGGVVGSRHAWPPDSP
jgi:hypothetical protein